jgi:hypothetical protein
MYICDSSRTFKNTLEYICIDNIGKSNLRPKIIRR